MANEKDRWWCEGCKLELRPHEVYGSNEDGWECLKQRYHTVYFLPAAALDAYTAEVVERCAKILDDHCERVTIPVLEKLTENTRAYIECEGRLKTVRFLAAEIRALAPRKEG